MLLKNEPSGTPSQKSCRVGVQEPLVLRTSPPGRFDVCQSGRQPPISFSPRRSLGPLRSLSFLPGKFTSQGDPRQTGEASLAPGLKGDFSFLEVDLPGNMEWVP